MDNKPWLKNYDEGVPASLMPYPETTLIDVVAEKVRTQPDRPALLFKGTSISYAEMDRLSDAFAAALAGLGIKKGDRVAILMANSPQYVIAEMGIWKIGAIVASLNPLYTGPELEHGLNECGAETVVVLSSFYDKVKGIQSRTAVKRVIASNIKEYLPPILRLLFTLVREKKDGHRITLQAGDYWFQELLKQNAGKKRPAVEVRPGDEALILFTGGTTGRSKAAVGTHQGLVMTGMQVEAWFKLSVDDVFLTALPLFHVFAAAGVQPVALVTGGSMALVPNPRDLDDVINTIVKSRATFFPSVPTMFNALISHPAVQAGKADLTSIKLCISGASALLKDTKDRFEALTGSRIVEGYALTESMMAVCVGPVYGAYKVGSVGMPAPDVSARIADVATGEETLPFGPEHVGEIVLSAPQLMLGYWGHPEATAEILRNGELFTGDLGYMDEDGYIFIVDRKKDVIKPSGFQVWPREVEEVIAAHPAVREVGVAGIPDPKTTEAVKAWIVLEPGEALTAEEVRDYCKQSLAAYKVPRFVEFRSELPKSTVGKVLRRELVAEEAAKQQ